MYLVCCIERWRVVCNTDDTTRGIAKLQSTHKGFTGPTAVPSLSSECAKYFGYCTKRHSALMSVSPSFFPTPIGQPWMAFNIIQQTGLPRAQMPTRFLSSWMYGPRRRHMIYVHSCLKGQIYHMKKRFPVFCKRVEWEIRCWVVQQHWGKLAKNTSLEISPIFLKPIQTNCKSSPEVKGNNLCA